MPTKKPTRGRRIRQERPRPAAPADSLDDTIARAIELACRDIRKLSEAAPLRDAALSHEDAVVLQRVTAAIEGLLVCAANLTQRRLTQEEAAPFREHVETVYMRQFGLDRTSEPHARAALVGLVEVAIRDLRQRLAQTALGHTQDDDTEPREAISEVFGVAAGWVLDAYAEDFGSFAKQMATAEKRQQLAVVLYWWWMRSEGVVSETNQWTALEALGRGVFLRHDAEDWRKNVWWKFRASVLGDPV